MQIRRKVVKSNSERSLPVDFIVWVRLNKLKNDAEKSATYVISLTRIAGLIYKNSSFVWYYTSLMERI